jgi:hypothetical protein
VTRRDKDVTWRSLGTLCRERDWSKPRAIYELQNGLRFRTIPPGHEPKIDWHDPSVLERLDLAASELSYASPQRIKASMGQAEARVMQGAEAGRQNAIRDLQSYGIDPSSGRYAALDNASRVQAGAAAAGAGNQQRMADIAFDLTLGIEVMPPVDAEVPSPPVAAAAALPAPPKMVSEAALRGAVRAIVEKHPPGTLPLDEETLHRQVETQLEVQVSRERVLAARDDEAPHFKRRVGRPRKSEQ